MYVCVYFLSAITVVCVCQEPGSVRLERGYDGSGIVQIFHEDAWKSICGWNFRDQEASVTCRQLGYLSGRSLPMAAYGDLNDLDPYPDELRGCPLGTEARLVDCEFSQETKCSPPSTVYASVNCYNDTPVTPANTVKLDNTGPEPGYFSRISVYKADMWGHICSSFWDDVDADVACRQLGFAGGLATYADADASVPFLIGEITCNGSDVTLDACQLEVQFCYANRTAGVFCYATQAPEFTLVGGARDHMGKVVMTVDDQQGLLCRTGVTWQETDIICQALGYVIGDPLKIYHETPGVDTVFLDGIDCMGSEKSLFACRNDGWKAVTDACHNTTNALSVDCFDSVWLNSDVQETADVYMGRVQVWNGARWMMICAEVFQQEHADMVCSDMEYSVAERLVPSAFGSRSSSLGYIRAINCTDNETNLANCDFTLGRCQLHDEQATVLCMQDGVVSEDKVIVEDGTYGRVLIERFGKEGTICRRGWDDNDAAVVCRMAGYNHGIALGTQRFTERYKPVWITDVNCTGDESNLSECEQSITNGEDWECAEDLVAAGVLCFISEPPAVMGRLGEGLSPEHGRVEIYHDGSGWGTVCNSSWTYYDASVFCRQLGFAEGQPHAYDFSSTPAPGPVLLAGLQCDGSEATLYQCPSSGWNRVPSTCENHAKDAGVYCYKHVRLYPASFYGAVLFHTNGAYGTVCADGFDQNAASVVCRDVGFAHAMPICCSALGPLSYPIVMSEVTCTGTEMTLQDCDYVTTSATCSTGNYAAVVCAHSRTVTSSLDILTDGKARVTYFNHPGYICADDFTDTDAKVICGQDGYGFGMAYKSSALGLEPKLRWLRGMNCTGDETHFSDCSGVNWGQIGVCSWDSVAGVMCANDQGSLGFDIQLVGGTSTAGRVEIKIANQWGTLCGKDMTQSEAVVICRQLGYKSGDAMSAGFYGAGIGDVKLTGIKCAGTESTIRDCVWVGYQQTSGLCGHDQDAAVRCHHDIRLDGSTTVNYGRLEVYKSEDSDWLAVCDRNVNTNSAKVICRQLGYQDGELQAGSPLGPTDRPITITGVTCDGQSYCTFEKGVCSSGRYIALYCSESTVITEGVSIRLPSSSFYGPVSMSRYGLWGAICSVGFDDADAQVVCKQLNYVSGYAVSSYAVDGFPIVQGDVRCTGEESGIADCPRGFFSQDHGCYNHDTVAGVFCFNADGVTFAEQDTHPRTGRMETILQITANGEQLFISGAGFTDIDANVYCRSQDFAGGSVHQVGMGHGNYGVADVTCTGDETSLFQCPGTWDPLATEGKIGDLAAVTCYNAVSLVGGGDHHGILYATLGPINGLVCAAGFDDTDAAVACRTLGYSTGLSLCCSPYVFPDSNLGTPVMTDVACAGTEVLFTDCPHEAVSSDFMSCIVNYAAVACYNGAKPTDFSLKLASPTSYSGAVVMTYMNVAGRICADGWGDHAAHVVCTELGYSRGLAYFHLRNVIRQGKAPYWTTDVQCNGNEHRVSECPGLILGGVIKCESQHYAGVVCYDNEGVFYRLGGGNESRTGRVEVSINGEWRSICGFYWGLSAAHVVCKMMGFRAGEAIPLSFTPKASGPVWQADFACSGSEESLNNCPFSGWVVSTSADCVSHSNDAAAFCYTSVKLSSGVGRQRDRGGVLFYWNDEWHTVCSDGFNDTSAAAVCRELGFQDGQAQCCSAYGTMLQYNHLVTHKVACSGEETDVTDCLVREACTTQEYASVICYGFPLTTTPISTAVFTTPPEPEAFNALPIIIAVVVFGVLVLIAVVVVYFYRNHQRQKRELAAKESFGNAIVSEHIDGSVVATNRLHGLVNTPEMSRVQYSNVGGTAQADEIVFAAYNNPGHSTNTSARGEPITGASRAPEGANMTVINVGSHIYDSIKADRDNSTGAHGAENVSDRTYDNLRRDDADRDSSIGAQAGGNVPDRTYDNLRRDDTSSVSSDDHFYLTLAEQPEVTRAPQADATQQPDTDLFVNGNV